MLIVYLIRCGNYTRNEEDTLVSKACQQLSRVRMTGKLCLVECSHGEEFKETC